MDMVVKHPLQNPQAARAELTGAARTWLRMGYHGSRPALASSCLGFKHQMNKAFRIAARVCLSARACVMHLTARSAVARTLLVLTACCMLQLSLDTRRRMVPLQIPGIRFGYSQLAFWVLVARPYKPQASFGADPLRQTRRTEPSRFERPVEDRQRQQQAQGHHDGGVPNVQRLTITRRKNKLKRPVSPWPK